MKKIIFLLLFAIVSVKVSAQFTQYIIQFSDKEGTPYSLGNPINFLSQKSIDRRTRQNIPLDETDLPIVPRYIDSVRLAGNVHILNHSKWLNQVCIKTSDLAALEKINSFSFVLNAQPVKRVSRHGVISKNKFISSLKEVASPSSPTGINGLSYGSSFGQIHIHEGEYLHDKGFRGKGMTVAIIDAGFYHYQTVRAFDSVRYNNRILDTYDFVELKPGVNEENAHGMYCFSIMAANLPGQLVGSSPGAQFLLYRSEDISSESPLEEQNWAAAAERSDSAGADIISTSLGYTAFDNPAFNHTYADMDGRTTISARAASIAATKGIILLVAAGNEGNNPWHFICTPGDAENILTVGAVDVSGNVGSFSSYGPSADGRVKPTVASVGVATFVATASGGVASGNGTSFATPNLAGLVACLWQAFPDFSSTEIMDAVIKSSSTDAHPDDRIGYGIPNFRVAYESLLHQRTLNTINSVLGENNIVVFPNPFRNNFTIYIKPLHTATGNFLLYDAAGKLCGNMQANLQAGSPQAIQYNQIKALPKGIYILKFTDGTTSESFKLLAQ